MRKKILKVFFVILTGITVTLTGCELSGSNESAQTESESGKDAVKFIPNLTTAVTCLRMFGNGNNFIGILLEVAPNFMCFR